MSFDVFTIVFGALVGVISLAVSIIRHQVAARLSLLDKRIDEIKEEVDNRHRSIKKRMDSHVSEDKMERLKLIEDLSKIRESVIKTETKMELVLNGKQSVKSNH